MHLKSVAISFFLLWEGLKPALAIRSGTEVVHLLNRKSEYSLTKKIQSVLQLDSSTFLRDCSKLNAIVPTSFVNTSRN